MLEYPNSPSTHGEPDRTSSRLSDYSLVKEHINRYAEIVAEFVALFSANDCGNFRYRRRVRPNRVTCLGRGRRNVSDL